MIAHTLLAITPDDGRDVRPWVDALAHAGLSDLLLRERSASPSTVQALYDHATRCVARVWVHLHCVPSLTNVPTRVHLPSDADIVSRVKQFPKLGVSAHTPQEVARACGRSLLCSVFAVYRPTSKPDDPRTPLGEAAYLDIAPGRPVWALGGLTPTRCQSLAKRGATGCAVLGDLFGQNAPKQAAERFLAYCAAVSSSNSDPTTKTSGS